MKKVTPRFDVRTDDLERTIESVRKGLDTNDFGIEALRKRVLSSGIKIRKASPKLPENEVNILCADSAFVKKELRFNALWGLHCVTVYASFDGEQHRDLMVGGSVYYKDLMYESFPEVGRFVPYQDIDQQMDIIRINREYGAMVESFEDLKGNMKIDFFLVDGSPATNEHSISKIKSGENVPSKLDRLLERAKVVGMVEDSSSVDIAKKFDLNVTNLALFDMILAENEYVTQMKDGLNVCYLKLPRKELDYVLSKESSPITVRWEFAYNDFEKDLENLVAMWKLDNDLLHPQIYPLRLTDYLTRRVKVAGILDKIIRDNNLKLRYRDMRTQ